MDTSNETRPQGEITQAVKDGRLSDYNQAMKILKGINDSLLDIRKDPKLTVSEPGYLETLRDLSGEVESYFIIEHFWSISITATSTAVEQLGHAILTIDNLSATTHRMLQCEHFDAEIAFNYLRIGAEVHMALEMTVWLYTAIQIASDRLSVKPETGAEGEEE